jgi:hypothetical protein
MTDRLCMRLLELTAGDVQSSWRAFERAGDMPIVYATTKWQDELG